jgi:PAS domain S-box-containing protein
LNVRAERRAAELLIEAGAVLASSLDVATTMRQVASLTVPVLADICVIDLRGANGRIDEAAVAAAEPELAHELEAMRTRHPIDPQGPHPVAQVIESGEPMLLEELSDSQLSSFATADEHERFMIASGYRSAVVAPLAARARTLGTISVLRTGDHQPYDQDDVEIVCELARRAALAIDNARLFGELQRLDSLQQAILSNLAEAITVENAHGQTVFANSAAAELFHLTGPEQITGAAPGELAATFLIFDEQAREVSLDDLPGRRLFRGESPEPMLVRNIVRATGEERWLIIRSSPIRDPVTGEVVLAANVFENITEVKRVQLAESFMAQASRVLASSMDYGETLQRIARLAVPQIAAGCAIDLVDEQGEIRQVAVHHADPDKRALASELGRRFRRTIDGPGQVAEVIRTGETRVFASGEDKALLRHALDAEHERMLRALNATTVIIVPLLSGVQTLGAITLISSQSLHRPSGLDLSLAERLGRRAGTAVENARLYTARARIAHTLQRGLLPESLPAVPGAEVRARYHAAGELNEVGGDFYDVFPRGEDWVLVIGDVVGKGARAAGVTALARHTLRAAAMGGASSEDMLRLLHRALCEQPSGADMCTVCLAELKPAADPRRLRLALAGHPPPLLMRGGEVRQVGRPGTLLGVIEPVRVCITELELEAGDTLLMYTDGVLDAGRSGTPLGERGLVELCRAAAEVALEQLLEDIERAALERASGSPRDDIALLGLRLH